MHFRRREAGSMNIQPVTQRRKGDMRELRMKVRLCIAEIRRCVADRRASDIAGGAFIGEMNWREQLYYVLENRKCMMQVPH